MLITNRCIIVQGPSTHVEEVKSCWKDIPIIFSTWEGEEINYKDSDKVIFNKPLSDTGIKNLYCQQETSLKGLLLAKKQGYTRAFKWRSECICTSPNKLIESLSSGLNFLCWHKHREGYLVDYIMEGPIDDLIELWSFPKGTYAYAEQALTQQVVRKSLGPINFFGQFLTEDNDIIWRKPNLRLSSYKNCPSFVHEFGS